MADLNDDTIRELNDSIRELSQVMQTSMGISGSSSASMKDLSRASASASTATTSAAKDYSKSSKDASVANLALASAAYKTGESFRTLWEATKESKDALLTFGKTMTDTREGLAKYGSALNQASGALSTGLAAFGPLGRVVGSLLKPLTEFAVRSLEFRDNLFAAKDELAKFGAVGRHTVDDIAAMGKASGYSSSELQKYAKMATSAGLGLVNLGGSVNQGVAEFAKLTAITKEERARLLSLGVSMDDFVQNTADFIKLQSLSGKAITETAKANNGLQRAAKEYTENLLILAAMSGEDVNTQKQKQQQLAMEHETQVANLEMSIKIKQLEKTDAEEASRLKKQMDMENASADKIRNEFGMDTARAFQHYIKTGIVTPETMKLMNSLGMSIFDLKKGFEEGRDDTAKFIDGLKKGDEQLVLSQGFALKANREYAKLTGQEGERLQKAASSLGKSYEERLAEAKKQMDSDTVQKTKAEKERAALLEEEKKMREKADEAAKAIADKLTPAILTTAEKINQTIDRLGEFIGHVKLAGLALAALAGSKVLGGAASLLGGTIGGGGGAGTATKVGSALAKGANILKGASLGGAIAIGGDIAADVIGRDTIAGKTIGAGANILGAASTGAMIGGLAGPAGAAAGAVIGGTGAALWEGYNYYFGQPKPIPGPDQSDAETRRLERTGTSTPKGSISSLLDTIASKESRGDYNVMVDFAKTPKPLTTMTIAEVLAMQTQMGVRNAAGKYQIQKDTLAEYMGRAGLGPNDLFNEANQDRLAMVLLERRGLRAYLDKKITPDQFADNLSKEWAALPYRTGQSYYADRGGNRAHMTREELISALPKARLGGSFSGPNSGYPVMLHGMETVVPTPNPNTSLLKVEGEAATNKIASALSGMNSDALQSIMQELYTMMEEKLTDMVDKLSTSNDLQDKLLKYQM